MFAPILPSPTKPICMLVCPRGAAGSASRRGCADSVGEACEAGVQVAGDVNADHAPAVGAQRLQIAGGLRALEHREGVRRSRDGDISGVVRSDLDVDTGVGATLVQLAGAVQEAGAES